MKATSYKKNFLDQTLCIWHLDRLKLTNDITYYHFSSQAELTIDGVDDKEEMGLTQVMISTMDKWNVLEFAE